MDKFPIEFFSTSLVNKRLNNLICSLYNIKFRFGFIYGLYGLLYIYIYVYFKIILDIFELRAISVGIIITRCDELQDIFNELDRGSSYGASTTHMSKLLPRLQGGSGGGCPILVFGISKSLYVKEE